MVHLLAHTLLYREFNTFIILTEVCKSSQQDNLYQGWNATYNIVTLKVHVHACMQIPRLLLVDQVYTSIL